MVDPSPTTASARSMLSTRARAPGTISVGSRSSSMTTDCPPPEVNTAAISRCCWTLLPTVRSVAATAIATMVATIAEVTRWLRAIDHDSMKIVAVTTADLVRGRQCR